MHCHLEIDVGQSKSHGTGRGQKGRLRKKMRSARTYDVSSVDLRSDCSSFLGLGVERGRHCAGQVSRIPGVEEYR